MTDTGHLTAAFSENLTTNTSTPQWWLAQFGWTNEFDAAATNDIDTDGMPTWTEYLAGTDPTTHVSCLRFDDLSLATGESGTVVSWQSVDGKYYALERGTNLMDDPVCAISVRTNIIGIAPMNTETDKTATGSGPWFYRVRLE